jgi:hypothetical protein
MIYKNICYAIESADTEFYENNKFKRMGKTYKYIIPFLGVMSLFTYTNSKQAITRARFIINKYNQGKFNELHFMDTSFLIPNPYWKWK